MKLRFVERLEVLGARRGVKQSFLGTLMMVNLTILSASSTSFAHFGMLLEVKVASPERQAKGPSEIRVSLTLTNTQLSEAQVVQALKEEFGVQVTVSQAGAPLSLRVNGRYLTAAFVNDEGEAVSRKLLLPAAPTQQADAVALLAGNLARDEAALLLAELTRAREAQALEEKRLANEARLKKEEATPQGGGEAEAKAEPKKEELESKEVEEKGDTAPASEGQPIPLVPFSFSFSGDLATPPKLSEKQTRFGLGVVYKDVGSVDGFAASLLTLRNRGRAVTGAGRGFQGALIWLGRDEEFKGVSISAIAVTERGGTQGAQVGGVIALQDGDVVGAQLSMVAAVAKGRVDGAQIGVITAAASGELEGAQVSAIASLLKGNGDGFQGSAIASIAQGSFDGVQASAILSSTRERLEGFQMGLVTLAGEIDGLQLGGVNVARRELRGSQIGVVNFSAGSGGTQIGLVNIGGQVRGSQIGLLNIAKDVDGVALAPVNIVPGLRTQFVTHASYAPQVEAAGVPDAMMYYVGMKVHSHSFYSELSFGLGPEALGDIEYAPGVAFGARLEATKKLFFEVDAQYQFQKAFSSSTARQHAILGRVAVGYQVTDLIAPYVGGGPRFNIRSGDDLASGPELSWAPHVYGGFQFF